MANPIMRDLQSLQPSALVELFELDMSSFGAGVVFFHAGTNELCQPVVWKGVTYQPYPIKAEGFELSGSGALPKPKITVSDIGGFVSALTRDYDDLVGAKLTRRMTFARYLDAINYSSGNPSANPDAGFDDEIWWVNQKTSEVAGEYVVFELASILDVQGLKLPGAQVMRICRWQYRVWTGASFDYVQASCPYAGSAMFDVNNRPVQSGALDVCDHRLSGCAARYGPSAILPFGGFPAANKYTT